MFFYADFQKPIHVEFWEYHWKKKNALLIMFHNKNLKFGPCIIVL